VYFHYGTYVPSDDISAERIFQREPIDGQAPQYFQAYDLFDGWPLIDPETLGKLLFFFFFFFDKQQQQQQQQNKYKNEMSKGVLLLAVLATCLVATCIASAPPNRPLPPNAGTFASQYQVELLYQIDYFDTREPIRMVYDAVNNRQRIEFYNGMDTYIYLYDQNITYAIFPEVDHLVCEQLPLEYADFQSLTAFFPNISSWEYKGWDSKNDIECFKWEMETVNYNVTGKYEFYVDQYFLNPIEYKVPFFFFFFLLLSAVKFLRQIKSLVFFFLVCCSSELFSSYHCSSLILYLSLRVFHIWLLIVLDFDWNFFSFSFCILYVGSSLYYSFCWCNRWMVSTSFSTATPTTTVSSS